MEEYTPSQPGDPDQAAGLAEHEEEELPSVLGEHTASDGTRHSWELKSTRLHGKAEKAIATAPWRQAAKPNKVPRLNRPDRLLKDPDLD